MLVPYKQVAVATSRAFTYKQIVEGKNLNSELLRYLELHRVWIVGCQPALWGYHPPLCRAGAFYIDEDSLAKFWPWDLAPTRNGRVDSGLQESHPIQNYYGRAHVWGHPWETLYHLNSGAIILSMSG